MKEKMLKKCSETEISFLTKSVKEEVCGEGEISKNRREKGERLGKFDTK
jgi:hypothetical protein